MSSLHYPALHLPYIIPVIFLPDRAIPAHDEQFFFFFSHGLSDSLSSLVGNSKSFIKTTALMPRGCCSDVECWPLLSTAFTLFFPLLFSLLQTANTSTNIGSTKECFQILLECFGLTLPLCQKPEPAVHSSTALWPYLFFLLLPGQEELQVQSQQELVTAGQ